MSERVELDAQKSLIEVQIDSVQEIKAHIVKAQSVLELVTNSLEAKVKDTNCDIASELNSLVTVYDQLEHALQDADDVEKFLAEAEIVDEKNA
jgi:hypothetical protein